MGYVFLCEWEGEREKGVKGQESRGMGPMRRGRGSNTIVPEFGHQIIGLFGSSTLRCHVLCNRSQNQTKLFNTMLYGHISHSLKPT
ncbi:hypothetical protein MTR_5g039035 [Medicago truncatula]|uniref:Uncharacterized protein n=1 Tax=Medicago truncatula TaxID=3880 RepID=A0A072UDF1_MEDTR|nr:hypothetical protein MTR_5g039035 [Medicago truncatula]